MSLIISRKLEEKKKDVQHYLSQMVVHCEYNVNAAISRQHLACSFSLL